MSDSKKSSEAVRLENLWAGEFGNDYIERNKDAGKGRDRFWNDFLRKYPVKSALEIGCNVGANLQWISAVIPPSSVFAVDINQKAVRYVRKTYPDINVAGLPARQICFRDAFVDLAFTAGVLIHQPENTLPLVMNEVVRCSQRYVLCLEYYAPETVEVPYRNQSGALFKRDYGGLYQALFPELKLIEKGFMDQSQGWDDVTWWLFSKHPQD